MNFKNIKKIFILFGTYLVLIFSQSANAIVAESLLSELQIDGGLDKEVWKLAKNYDLPFQNLPRGNSAASYKTSFKVLFDKDFLYFGIIAYDSDTDGIIAPLVRRDMAGGNHDTLSIWLDPIGEKKFAQVFKVNASGVLSDGIWDEESSVLNYTPDFEFTVKTKRILGGWSAEFKIPFRSLRYSAKEINNMNILIFRNLTRGDRIQLSNADFNRDPTCYLCKAEQLTGLSNLPDVLHLTVNPYLSFRKNRSSEAGENISTSKFESGVDFKAKINPQTVVDLTYRPDFSQLELDTPQLSSNLQFALSFPEKRSFFLEGVDLFALPLASIYTRSITNPLLGSRVTYRDDNLEATALTVSDRGGGYTVVPGTYSSRYLEQIASQATIARVRTSFGGASLGAVISNRNYENGAENWMSSVDATFRPSNFTKIRAQILQSQYEDKFIKNSGNAFILDQLYEDGFFHTNNTVTEISKNFRSDNSYVVQNGIRSFSSDTWVCYKTNGFFNNVCPTFTIVEKTDLDNALLNRSMVPRLYLNGVQNTVWSFEPRFANYNRINKLGPLHHIPTFYFSVSGNPSTYLTNIIVEAELGKNVDVLTDKVAFSRLMNVLFNLRPFNNSETIVKIGSYWLKNGNGADLLAETNLQITNISHISATDFIRTIFQTTRSARDQNQYILDVNRLSKSKTVSLLYTHTNGLNNDINIGMTYAKNNNDPLQAKSTFEIFSKIGLSF